ncbi:GIY-YIG nuclease family protein [Gracilimonas sp.]|uniref:GIY-YIG nuclease family protein n=1 Tax=Gracilimonas sp. TaxID=1974203 RepID=UPI0032EF19FD
MTKAYVYILSNIARTTLYIGVTNNLNRRIWEHKQGEGSEFTAKYKCIILLYAEEHGTISDAIEREKQLKNWKRAWKWELIKTLNPDLADLYPTLRG